MLSKLQRLMNRAHVDDSDGFTLIELLIVVVIIGILAAIAIPQFSSTKEQAYDATAKSDLRNLMTAQEGHFATYTQYGSSITTVESNANSSTVFFDPSDGVPAGTNPGIQIANTNTSSDGSVIGFCAQAQHNSSSNTFRVRVGNLGTDNSGDGAVVSGQC